MEEGVRPGVPHQGRARVQVVVVEHHERVGLVLDRGEHRPGDVRVHGLVAVVPRVGLLAADVRRVGEVPEVVLDEPEDRVCDDVVEAVVGLGVALDQEDLVGDAVELQRDRLPTGLTAHRDVLVGHRRRDPQGAAMRDQPAERRDQAAPSPPYGALPLRTQLELRRPPVGDDHQAGIVAHTSISPNSRSQSRSSRGVRKCSRARSLPARPSCLARPGSLNTSIVRSAASSGEETR